MTDHSLSLAITCWFCPGVLWLSWGSGEQTEGRLCQFLLSGITNSLHRWRTASALGSARLDCLQPPRGRMEGDILYSHKTACNVSVVCKLRQYDFTGGRVSREENQQITWKYLLVWGITEHFPRNQKMLIRKMIPNYLLWGNLLPQVSITFFTSISKPPALLN